MSRALRWPLFHFWGRKTFPDVQNLQHIAVFMKVEGRVMLVQSRGFSKDNVSVELVQRRHSSWECVKRGFCWSSEGLQSEMGIFARETPDLLCS